MSSAKIYAQENHKYDVIEGSKELDKKKQVSIEISTFP